MNKKFYEKRFDDATKVKLEVFRQYLRKWFPVFPGSRRDITIYDFFAGRGRDGAGNHGSPLIIVDNNGF